MPMLRFISSMSCLVLIAGAVSAQEGRPVTGKIKAVDVDKGTLTVTVGRDDKEFTIAEGAKIVDARGEEIKDRLKDDRFKEGSPVQITSDKDGKVTEVKVLSGA